MNARLPQSLLLHTNTGSWMGISSKHCSPSIPVAFPVWTCLKYLNVKCFTLYKRCWCDSSASFQRRNCRGLSRSDRNKGNLLCRYASGWRSREERDFKGQQWEMKIKRKGAQRRAYSSPHIQTLGTIFLLFCCEPKNPTKLISVHSLNLYLMPTLCCIRFLHGIRGNTANRLIFIILSNCINFLSAAFSKAGNSETCRKCKSPPFWYDNHSSELHPRNQLRIIAEKSLKGT